MIEENLRKKEEDSHVGLAAQTLRSFRCTRDLLKSELAMDALRTHWKMLVLLLLFYLAFQQQSAEGAVVPSKYLLKANSSFIVTEISQDGSAQAATYITDNFKKIATPYGKPVNLSSPVQPAKEPGSGIIGPYERSLYCFNDISELPVSLYVNQSEEELVSSMMNSLGLANCKQMITADVNGDGTDELVVLSDIQTITVVIFETDIDHSPEKTKVSVAMILNLCCKV